MDGRRKPWGACVSRKDFDQPALTGGRKPIVREIMVYLDKDLSRVSAELQRRAGLID